MPFGPYILCALIEIRSASAALSSKGSLAAPCTASTWKKRPVPMDHRSKGSEVGNGTRFVVDEHQGDDDGVWS